MRTNKKLVFTKGYEVYSVPPQAHYYEEVYPILIGLKKIGLRGDKNFMFYNIEGHGTAYYEKKEMEISAKSAYKYFQKTKNRRRYFEKVNEIISNVANLGNQINTTDLTKLSNKQVASLFLKVQQLESKAFTYYIVSQPYRISYFEEEIRSELAKRVARTRINHYMALLTASEKQTKISMEEIDWLAVVIKHRTHITKFYETNIRQNYPDLWDDIKKHYDKYKTLSLGDGSWDYDINYFLKNISSDFSSSISSLKQRHLDSTARTNKVLTVRNELTKTLYLDPKTIETVKFLAEIGHSRLKLRIDGFILNIKNKIDVSIELSKRVGIPKGCPVLEYMTPCELEQLAKRWIIVPEQTLRKRMGEKSEYLILTKNGKYKTFYGPDANKQFNKLIPKINYDESKNMTGLAAVLGNVKDRVTVYHWGDDIDTRINTIKKFPILVAGQTRPAMMPIIRLAKGIVTDEGGITSHAAIISRELGIPSLIGVVNATKTFKDGDMIELDANNGTVRKVL